MASFKGYKRSIKLGFDYDEVKEGIPNVKKQMAVLNSEFKKSSAEAEANGKSLDKLGVRYDYLGEKIKIQEKEVEAWRRKLEDVEKAQGNNAKAVQNATTSLEIAQAKLGQTRAELDKVTQELDKQKATLGKTSDEWENLSEKTSEVGKTLTTKLTLPILAAGAASFKLGADMEDALGKTSAVFNKNSKEIEEWAQSAYKSFGLSKTTALDMANSFGALASGMGLGKKETLEYSKALTQLSVDMVAFHGGRLDVAETALNSIFTGETESLKKYGIVMTQANLQQFAYSQGIKTKIADMTEAEKVQLRYNFVMEKSKDVIGHYSKEQDNATTQLLKFKEGIKMLGENFSEHILPLFLPLIEGLNKLIEKFAGLSDGTKKFIVILGGVAAVAGPIIWLMGTIFGSITKISDGISSAGKMVTKLGEVGTKFGSTLTSSGFFGFAKWALIIAGVAVAIAAVIMALNDLLGKGSSFAKSLGDINNIVGGIQDTKVRGYAVGTNYLKNDQLAVVHEGEAIIPKESNPWNPDASTPYGSGGGGGDTFVLNVRMDEIDDVNKLVNMFNQLKQTKRAGVVY